MFYNTVWENTAGGNILDENVCKGDITYLSVPLVEGWDAIGEYAIAYFPELEEIFIPACCWDINKNAIIGCPKLKRIVIAKRENSLPYAPWGADPGVEVVWDEKAKPRGMTFVPSPVHLHLTTDTPEPENYRIAMLELLEQLKAYAVHRNHPNFQLIGNGNSGMFEEDPEHGWGEEEIDRLSKAIHSVMAEDVFYGCDIDWNMVDDGETPWEYSEEFIRLLDNAKKKGVTPLVIDYCWTPKKVQRSYDLCKKYGYADYVATHRDLDNIPEVDMEHNINNIYSMADVKSFIVLNNPEHWATKESYLNDLAATWYDCIICDQGFNGEVMLEKDIRKLRYKPNGARRMVCCYMSLGEADDFRTYWDKAWNNEIPEWIAERNYDWPGAYKVKYWTDEWKKICWGTDDSYLDLILRANYDGVFLDVIDAYAYFEEKRDKQEEEDDNDAE